MKDKYLTLSLNLLKIGLMVLGVVATLLILKGGGTDDAGTEIPAMGPIGFALQFTYVMIGVCLITAILFAIAQIVFNIKNSVMTLAGIAVFVIICFIAYSMASEEILPEWTLRNENMIKEGSEPMFTPAASKWSDAGIYSLYFFMGLSFLAIIGGEVYSLVKKIGK